MTRSLYLLLLLGVTATWAASIEQSDSSSSEQDDAEDTVFPGLISALGAQLGPDAAILEEEDTDVEEEQPTAPCCFPRVWQGRMVSEVGVTGRETRLVRGIDQVFVDGANQRLAGNKLDFLGRGKFFNISYILLVKANQTATLYIFSKTAQKCRTKNLTNVVWRQQCIPANSTLRGTFSLGPAAGGLTVQSWTFCGGNRRAAEISERPSPRPRVFFGGDILVTPGQCIPVVLQEHGAVMRGGRRTDEFQELEDDESEDEDRRRTTRRPKPRPRPRPRGEAFVGSFFFSNITLSISDPSVFTPPSYCSKTSNGLYFDDLSEAEDEMSTILDRFLVL